ncbi:dihydroorotate dehydrogenase electron transfer subunit [Nocardioides hwasunensis]|uniref:Dihydroorotate dehydrogenase electron transfer subunit n=1 Tax=Nocardioides hwasunensis TaxID=397258 RepID=A0ABR8MF31_9ACTN|nr:dihydroorotate dehydrogenase electron transfer subunit [Nocardioides hwasunensis]MBD3914508.1 dihydroorotate dehydrogenase electron transfer subunit [Nocardioides hwasunensis]
MPEAAVGGAVHGSGHPVHVDGEVVATKRIGGYQHLTLTAPGVPEGFRAGNFVAVSVAGHVARRALWIHRVRASSAFGPTLDVVVERRGDGSGWLAAQPVGTRIAITGPLGRPFALPKEAVSCLLVGEGYAAAPLFPLAERLRERGCAVSLVVSAPDESRLLSALEARRSARSVTVLTADGSVGLRGRVGDHVGDLLARSEADVVYAAGPHEVLRAAASAAERVGAWSQVAVETWTPCGTGLCHGCPLPVVGEDGVARVVRACTEGPVVRGDRVRWDDL